MELKLIFQKDLKNIIIEKKYKTNGNTVYKKLLVLANTKLVARLLASDFPSENPRPQTCNFTYTKTLCETHFESYTEIESIKNEKKTQTMLLRK